MNKKFRNPASLQQVIADGYNLGSIKRFVAGWHKMVKRDLKLKSAKAQIQFANAAVAKPEACVGFSNAISIGADGWAQIAPFGDFPSFAVVPQPDGSCKRLQAIQRIDKTCADTMVKEFQNSRKGVKKFFSGRPIYIGHPDVPGIGNKYPDKSAKGVIADLAVREDGLYGLPVFTNEGSDLVEKKKLRFFSGRLTDCEEGDPVNGIPLFTPTIFRSVGLTNQPHLPVQMLNEADACAAALEEQSTTNKMKKTLLEKIIGLCAKAGIELANTADEAATEAALDKLAKVDHAATFANERSNLEGQLTTEKSTVTAKVAEVTKLNSDLVALRQQFANERKAHQTALLNTAIKNGQITEADRPTWEGRLAVEANFANESEALAKLTPKVKTTSVTINRGDRKIELANAADRREMVAELVNEEMTKSGLDYDKAFSKVQKLHPTLFEAMAQPAKK